LEDFTFAVTAVYLAVQYFEATGESQSRSCEIDAGLQTPVPQQLQEPEVGALAEAWIPWILRALTSVVALKILLLLVRPVTLNLFQWSKYSLWQMTKQTQEEEQVSSEQQQARPSKWQECGEVKTTAEKSSTADIAAGHARSHPEAWLKLGNEWVYVAALSSPSPPHAMSHDSPNLPLKTRRPAPAVASAGGFSQPRGQASPAACSVPRDPHSLFSFRKAPADCRAPCQLSGLAPVILNTPAPKIRPPPGLDVGLPPGLEALPRMPLGVY